VIFDLGVGDPRIRPDLLSGWTACSEASSAPVRLAMWAQVQGPQWAKFLAPTWP
jgi:hypothetical protein